MPFTDAERAPSPECDDGADLATSYFSGGVDCADSGVGATLARECARLLPIQRAGSHCVVGGVRNWLQLSLGQRRGRSDRAATPGLPLSADRNLQIGGSLQLPVALHCGWTECIDFRVDRGFDSSDWKADLRCPHRSVGGLGLVLLDL